MNNYQEDLKKAIEEAFNCEFDDLYNSLKDNIFDINIMASFIVLTAKLVDELQKNNMYMNIFHYKSVMQIITFINKVNEFYTLEMLNTVKIKSDDNIEEIGFYILEKDKYKDVVEFYNYVISQTQYISPFDFVFELISNFGKIEYYGDIFPKLLELCSFILEKTNCYKCEKFRYLEKCIGCKPKIIQLDFN